MPLAGIEPAASRFGTVRSHPLSYKGKKWNRRDSNPDRSGANRVLSH